MKRIPVHYDHQPASRCIGKTARGLPLYVLTEDWTCSWEYNGLRRHLRAVAGYVLDFASIPRIGWSILGLTPAGIMCVPSTGHDILYRAKGGLLPAELKGCSIVNDNGNAVMISRKETDEVFRAFTLAVGVRRGKASLCYAIVRSFGGLHWGGPIPATGKAT